MSGPGGAGGAAGAAGPGATGAVPTSGAVDAAGAVPSRAPWPWERPARPRLHVLHVSMPTTEGTAVVARTYVREQLALGWNVTVACPSEGWLGYRAREMGARTRWWSATRDPGPSVLPEARRLRAIVRDVQPDVVHLHSAKAGLVGRLVLRGSVPTVYQPHGWSFLAATGRTAALARRWEVLASRWTDELVCVSEAEQEIGLDAGVRASTAVLPNGVDLDEHRPASRADRDAARTRLGLDREAPIAVCVGRLARQKGQADLLAVWPQVVAEVPEARLVLVGDGPDHDQLQRVADGLPGVELVGSRNDVGEWFAASTLVVVPSRWEGMALVPLEAMAAARCVVATDVAGITESVPPGAGVVVPLDDRSALADALVHRLRYRGEADDEGLVGRGHVEMEHDAATSARHLTSIYLRVLAARRHPRGGPSS